MPPTMSSYNSSKKGNWPGVSHRAYSLANANPWIFLSWCYLYIIFLGSKSGLCQHISSAGNLSVKHPTPGGSLMGRELVVPVAALSWAAGAGQCATTAKLCFHNYLAVSSLKLWQDVLHRESLTSVVTVMTDSLTKNRLLCVFQWQTRGWGSACSGITTPKLWWLFRKYPNTTKFAYKLKDSYISKGYKCTQVCLLELVPSFLEGALLHV